MGLSPDTVAWLKQTYPHVFVDGAAPAGDVVVVDATERFMYPTAGVGGAHRPQNCLDMLHLVEEFIGHKSAGCAPSALIVVLIDDGATVPAEKGVAHATRYGTAGEGLTPAPAMGGCAADDVSGTEYALPWEVARASCRARATGDKAPTLNHEWKEIMRDRSVRQRLARFVGARLARASTLGRAPGAVFLVSAPQPHRPGLGPEIQTVALRPGGCRTLSHYRGVLPPRGAGEADVQTPILLRWIDGHRSALGLPSGRLVVWVCSKDSDMIPVCAALTHALLDAFDIALLRGQYCRAQNRFLPAYVAVRDLVIGLRQAATRAKRDPDDYLPNFLFGIALGGCDFVKKVKACKPAALQAQLAVTPVVTRAGCAFPRADGARGLRCAEVWQVQPAAARDCLRRVWTAACKGRAGSDGQTLRDTLQHMRGVQGLGSLRIAEADCQRAEAMWRASLWVCYYWSAAARGPAAFERFATECCGDRSAASVSAPFGFIGAGGSVVHATQDAVHNLTLPTLRFWCDSE
jgi:hypothetical protein